MPRSRQQVARQSNDTILKLVATALGGDLFQRFEVSLPPIVAGLPSELPHAQVRTQETDLIFRLADDSKLNLEFQTQHRRETLQRFAGYNMDIVEHYGPPVHTVVLYGRGIRSAPDTVHLGSITFRVQNIFVGRVDGDATLRRLHEKVSRGEGLDAQDRIDLILSPLMRQRRALDDVLPDAAQLAQALPVDQLKPTMAALVGLAYHYVDERTVKDILEGIDMANLLQQYIEQGLEQGLEQGRKQGLVEGEVRGKRAAVRTVLRSRFGLLPEAADRRVAAAPVDELDVLVVRAGTVDNIDDL